MSQQSCSSPLTPPPSRAGAAADLYLIGAGIGGPHRMTREAVALIGGALTVLHLSPLDDELRALCTKGEVRSLGPLYESSDDPHRVYQAITQQILIAGVQAKRQQGYACFVTYGHPLWLVNSARDVLRRATLRELTAVAIPGLSSFDTILVDSPVKLDHGAQLYEAERFLRRSLQVEPRVPLVLFQLGDFGSPRLRPDRHDTERFAPLIDRLRQIYPPQHPAYIVLSAWREGMAPRITPVQLDTIEQSLALAHVGTTLVLPPTEPDNE